MKLKALNLIKSNGEWVQPGTMFEVKNKKEAKRLIETGAVEVYTEPVESDSDSEPVTEKADSVQKEVVIEVLMTVEGINRRIAEELSKRGVKSLEGIIELGTEKLIKVPGIGADTARKILDSVKELTAEGKEDDGEPDFSHLSEAGTEGE